jgi:hypothetical protein
MAERHACIVPWYGMAERFAHKLRTVTLTCISPSCNPHFHETTLLVLTEHVLGLLHMMPNALLNNTAF